MELALSRRVGTSILEKSDFMMFMDVAVVSVVFQWWKNSLLLAIAIRLLTRSVSFTGCLFGKRRNHDCFKVSTWKIQSWHILRSITPWGADVKGRGWMVWWQSLRIGFQNAAGPAAGNCDRKEDFPTCANPGCMKKTHYCIKTCSIILSQSYEYSVMCGLHRTRILYFLSQVVG